MQKRMCQKSHRIEFVVSTTSNHETNLVTRNNNGQIVTHPYNIGNEDGEFAIKVAITHSQYYQLNMNDDDIVVWYSIRGDKSIQNNNATPQENYNDCDYQKLENDGVNNYYIYNKGNITYSGVGHNGKLTEDEFKLFVNTMIAAYSAGIEATKPEILNSYKSKVGDKDYLYVDYDATKDKDETNEPLLTNDVIKLKEDGKYVKISDAGEKTLVDNASEGNVYAKRVRFTLKSFSVVTNKKMTVQYYPVYYANTTDGEVKVVLYDYPLNLPTYKKLPNENDDTAVVAPYENEKWDDTVISNKLTSGGLSITKGETNNSRMAFFYKMPDEKVFLENIEAIGVGKGDVAAAKNKAISVSSGSEYYVDIPITDNYYKYLFTNGGTNIAPGNIGYKYNVKLE